MSAAGTLRAGSRPIKEKATKEPQQIQITKTDGQNPVKNQPTQEQIRLAQMISHPNDPELSKKIEQIKELTKRKEDDVIIALHDAGNDTEKAVNMLLEGDDDQGEWKETVKKRKKPTPSAPTKSETLTNHVNDKGDKREESKDREQNHTDRSDGPPRRNRRPGIPIPRLSRGRGRDRGDFNKGDRERPTENGDWDQENDNTFRERGFERGRGRGRGGRGRGRGGGRNFRSGQRFEKDPQVGPQIDTWTNETAANAEKKQTWGENCTEDWNEDWTGSLEESKIFTASSIQQTSPNVDLPTPMNDTTNTFEQRFDLQAFAKSVVAAEASQAEAQFISQFNQQATESIKNTIGIGSSRPPGSTFQPVAPPPSSIGPLAALTQNSQPPPDNQRMQQASLSPTQSLSSQSPITTQSVLQQRPKAQRSKLPPPSKIPASAVEMPGHIVPPQDLQFSLEFGFGSDSSPFAFGDTSASSTKTYNTASTNVNSANLTNHLNQVSKAAESVISSSMMSSPSGNNAGLSNIDQTSPRTNMFQAAAYTSPAKKETSSLGPSNQLTSPETSSFLSNQADIKTSPLMGAQRPAHGQSVKNLSQGTLTSNKTDNSALSSYVQNSTNYQSSSFQSHKPSGLSSSAGYVTTTATQSNSFHGQFQSPTNQYQAALNQSGSNQFQQSQLQSATNQFQQNQLQTGSSQFQTNPNQFQAFQSAGSSFQANYAGNQSNSSSLYQNAAPSSVYQQATGSYHSRDSQSGSSFQNSAGQSASYQRDSQTKSSYTRDGQSGSAYQRESQSGTAPYPRDSQSASLTYSSRDAQTAPTAYQRDNQPANSFPRDNQTGSSAYQRDSQTGSTAFQRDSQSASSSFHCDTQPSSATFQKDTPSANSSYQRDAQPSSAAYQRDSQTGSSGFQRDNQSGPSYQRDSQSASSFSRDSQSSSFQRDGQTSASFQRDSQTFQRDSQSTSSFPRENQTSSAFQSQTSSFPRDSSQTSSFPRDSSQTSSSYPRDTSSQTFPRDNSQTSSSYVRESSQTGSSYPRDTQSGTAFQRDSQSSSAFQRDAPSSAYQRDSQSASSFQMDGQSSISTVASQSQSSFSSQAFGASSHQSGLQTSPLTSSKLTETLSKMTVKESSLETSTTQHESTSSTVSTVSLTTSVSSISSLTTSNSSVSSTVTTTNVISSKMSTLPANSKSKAPPNLPPGVPLVGAQYIVGQGTVPHFYGLQGVQQPLYTSYEDLQMLQQRLPLAANSYYDMGGYAVPTTLAGRDQVSIGNVPFTGTVTDNKLTRVEAQSPIPSTQQQTSQSQHQQQPYINLHYGYYAYPSVLPGAGGFQYPMFPMPPVSNTAAHAGTTANQQYQKTYTSHGYGTNKAYDDLTQSTDFTKSAYGASQSKGLPSQSAVGVGAGTLSSNDMSAYAKSHTQAFDKQAYHGGTPPPFNMSLATASQAGPMGAPTTPYGTPYLHMMPHQPHSMMHHPLQQDTSGASRSSQQTSTQQKTTGTKSYQNYWSGN